MLEQVQSMPEPQTTAMEPGPIPNGSQDIPPILSNREAVQALGGQLLRLMFEGGGFENMCEASGFGMALKLGRPVVEKRARQSLEELTDETAAWIVDQVHRLSCSFEDATGQSSPYHYE